MTNLAISIKNLSKSYPSGLQALKGVDLEIEQGDFFALLGPNGAGKSSAINILCSLMSKDEGQVKVFNFDLDTARIEAKACIGLVPQEFNFNQFDQVLEIVINQAGFYGVNKKLALIRAEHYLKKLGLWDKRHTVSRNLSGGMKRRLMIARALIHEPKLLILDEPTAGVDIELRRSMWQFLQEINAAGTTIIMTTHYLEEAESLCRGVAIIDRGKLLLKTTIKELLAGLNHETLLFDLEQELEDLPELENCQLKLNDAKTIEMVKPQNISLNQVFSSLHGQGIIIKSVRNKANRLETFFLNIIDSQTQGAKS